MSHFLYLVRHGEHQDAQHGVPDGPLSERGERQITAIAERLSKVPITGIVHSPLQAPSESAQLISKRLKVEAEPSALLMDCIPSGPVPDLPTVFEPFFGGITEAQVSAGMAQMADAAAEWLSPSVEDKHEVLVTHNFVISWFVREVMDAPSWRWLSLNQAHAGLTVIRSRTRGPHNLVTHNDLGHLPHELRTGLSVDPRL